MHHVFIHKRLQLLFTIECRRVLGQRWIHSLNGAVWPSTRWFFFLGLSPPLRYATQRELHAICRERVFLMPDQDRLPWRGAKAKEPPTEIDS